MLLVISILSFQKLNKNVIFHGYEKVNKGYSNRSIFRGRDVRSGTPAVILGGPWACHALPYPGGLFHQEREIKEFEEKVTGL